MTDQTITFGSRRVVLFTRVFQVVMPMFFVALGVNFGIVDQIFILATLLICELFMSSLVFARLTDSGVAYLRWRKWREVRWSEIGYGGVGPVGFISVRKVAPIWRRYLLLKAPNLSTEFIESSDQAKKFLKAIQQPSGRTN